MGSCCTKEEVNEPTNQPIIMNEILSPFIVVQNKSDIMINPSVVFIGIYSIENILVYVFSWPSNLEQNPNRFLVSPNIIEVLCEQCTIDINMILKQAKYLKNNKQWQDLYIQQIQ